jgi:VanZ family protein
VSALIETIGRAFRSRLSRHPLEMVVRVLPTVAYLALIYAVSSVPGQDLHSPTSDKVMHFLEYSLLGALLMFSFAGFVETRITTVHASTAWFFGALYAFSDEFHQSFVPNRDASFYDWLADVTGLAIALFIVYRLSRAGEQQ